MIGYFNRLTPKAAKELLMNVLPFPSHESILNKVSEDVRMYLPRGEKFDSNTFFKGQKV
jgi:hypothetical protein